MRALLLAALLLCLAGCHKDKVEPVKSGVVAPDPGAIYLDDDAPVELADYRGKPLLLLFFSNSCCADELEKFEQLAGEKVKDFAVLGVNVGDSLEEVTRITKEKTLPFRIAGDPILSSSHRYKLVGLPTLFVLDGKGVVLRRMIGKMGYRQLKKEVYRTLEEEESKS